MPDANGGLTCKLFHASNTLDTRKKENCQSYLPLATDDEFLEPVRGQFDGIHGLFGLGQPLVLEASLGRQPQSVLKFGREIFKFQMKEKELKFFFYFYSGRLTSSDEMKSLASDEMAAKASSSKS
jgi:hypothetical protein